MNTIIPGQTVALPVTGGGFPDNTTETWDILYCPNPPTLNFGYNMSSNFAPVGCSVVYDDGTNTLSVTMASLASLQAINPAVRYGTWAVVYNTQPGNSFPNGAGRSAFFNFTAGAGGFPPAPTLTATPQLVGNVPTIQLAGF